jgi:subtilisin family serine protease
VRVAIIDTGIDLAHPDLVANIDAGLGRNCIVGGSPQDDNGHGTHVAGIVAAADNGSGVIGVAPDARLVPIKVLDRAGSGSDSSVICAIDYLTGLATDGDPATTSGSRNMSFGRVARSGPVPTGPPRGHLSLHRRRDR